MGRESWFGYPELERFRARSKTLSGIFSGTGIGRVNVALRGTCGLAQGDAYTDNFFSVLGVTPQYGPFFSAGEDRADASVAILSDRYWRNRFGSDASIVGGAITINQIPFTVIGITLSEFSGIAVGSGPDVWVPLHALDRLKPDSKRWTAAFTSWMLIAGRLRPGVSALRAQAELDVIHRQLLAEQLWVSELRGSENMQRFVRESHLVLRTGARGAMSGMQDTYAFPLKLLMSVAGIVFLVACANVANLLLARASNRRREIAVRLALGAARARGAAASHGEHPTCLDRRHPGSTDGVAGQRGAGSHDLHRRFASVPLDVHPDWWIFGFTAAVSLLTGILFGSYSKNFSPGFRYLYATSRSGSIPRPGRFGTAILPSRIMGPSAFFTS